MAASPKGGRPVATIPVPRLHKPSGLARVRHRGEEYYLGPYGSQEAARRYSELLVALSWGKARCGSFQSMVDAGWSRGYVSKSVGRVRRVFRWGCENELVSPTTLQGLQAVTPLLAGRTLAKDHAPRQPVSQEQIDRVRDFVLPRTRDLIDLQLLTGARSGELVGLTMSMLDRSGPVWLACLTDHKTAHHGKERVLVFGPQAQAILLKYLTAKPSNRLFKISRRWYGHSVAAACDELGIPRWTPHWLRHTAATRLRDEYGLEVAQVILGHSRADMTQVYAALNLAKAVEVARVSR